MLYLASQSPRRVELLQRLGISFSVLTLDIPEQRLPTESPAQYVHRVAMEKAQAGLQQVIDQPHAYVLGADTEVVLDNDVFGKPATPDDACAMLRRLSGRIHQAITAVCLVSKTATSHVLSISEVQFAVLDEASIAAYVASGESMGRAGGYAIQGSAERFITRLSGSYSGVMGLPLYETSQLLHNWKTVYLKESTE